MAFPVLTESLTTLAELIPKIWGDRINDFYKMKLVMANFFTDRSDELSGGGNTLYTPTLTQMVANAKVNATPVTLNNPTETKVTLLVNKWFEVSFAIEDREAAQVKHSYYIMSRYATNAGYTMAYQLETDIAVLFAGFTTTVGAVGTAIADAPIRAAIAALQAKGIDVYTDTAFFFSPAAFWNDIQAIDRFALAVNSPGQNPVYNRPGAQLYGIPVYISNTLAAIGGGGVSSALAHKDAIHWATSPLGSGGSKSPAVTGKYGVRVQSNYIPEYLSTLTTADMLWGTVLNRPEAGVWIKGPA